MFRLYKDDSSIRRICIDAINFTILDTLSWLLLLLLLLPKSVVRAGLESLLAAKTLIFMAEKGKVDTKIVAASLEVG